MSYYKNHKKKAFTILKNVATHIKECKFDYEMIDLESALDEAKKHYDHYLKMQNNENYQPEIKHKSNK